MTKTQILALSIPYALLLLIVLTNLARVTIVYRVRGWFLDNDYQAYRRLPTFDEMVNNHWNRWTMASWQQYVRDKERRFPQRYQD